MDFLRSAQKHRARDDEDDGEPSPKRARGAREGSPAPDAGVDDELQDVAGRFTV